MKFSMAISRSVTCYRAKPGSLLRSVFRSFIGLWVYVWHRNNPLFFESSPLLSCRSKSTTCPRKGRLFRFHSNSTATSDGGAQKLGNDLHDSELIATKVCRLNGRKWNAMFWMPCRDLHWQDELQLSIWRFFGNLPFKICVAARTSDP